MRTREGNRSHLHVSIRWLLLPSPMRITFQALALAQEARPFTLCEFSIPQELFFRNYELIGGDIARNGVPLVGITKRDLPNSREGLEPLAERPASLSVRRVQLAKLLHQHCHIRSKLPKSKPELLERHSCLFSQCTRCTLGTQRHNAGTTQHPKHKRKDSNTWSRRYRLRLRPRLHPRLRLRSLRSLRL